MKMNRSMEEVLPLVAELTDKYTSKESSSIPYNKARQLMGAVLYCIREYETAGSTGMFEVMNNTSVTAREAYTKGYQMVLDKVEQTKTLYHEILIDFCSYRNLAYHETVEKGMPAFFVRYDARFYPQDHLLTLDYPLLVSLDHNTGIDRISLYIKCVGLEQTFLKQLPERFILHTLSAYHQEYQELLINVAGIVLRNLLGCMMAGKPVNCNGYTIEEQQNLNTVITNHSKEQLADVLDAHIDDIISRGYGGDKELKQYLSADIPDFVTELKLAAEYGHPERILAIAGK